jgi:hypothetical protein
MRHYRKDKWSYVKLSSAAPAILIFLFSDHLHIQTLEPGGKDSRNLEFYYFNIEDGLCSQPAVRR